MQRDGIEIKSVGPSKHPKLQKYAREILWAFERLNHRPPLGGHISEIPLTLGPIRKKDVGESRRAF